MWRLDPFSIGLLAAVGLAAVAPIGGAPAEALRVVTRVLIGAMFFLYGARLPRAAVVEALRQWRLHLVVLLGTYAIFPVLGLVVGLVAGALVSPALATGIVFLSTLPSTVQSSIAFTSIAHGNVAAAICSASLSNLLGVALTPLLTGLLLVGAGSGGFSLDAIEAIALQLLAPFVLGQILQPWLGAWVARRHGALGWSDRGAILLIVYAAFSDAVREGLWSAMPVVDLLLLVALDAALLAAILLIMGALGRRFARADRIAIIFCGSKKSLATGVPMANVLFSHGAVGTALLPLVVFHQMQLMVCAALARRWAREHDASVTRPAL